MTALASFSVCPERGFLPREDPLQFLPDEFADLDELGRELPKLLATTQTRAAIDHLSIPSVATLLTDAEIERAMMILSFLGHAYVWCDKVPPQSFPKSIAVAWHALATKLGRPPCLSYSSYALHNWRRIDPAGPIEAGNIALLQNFLGGVDEEWFVIIHIDIEMKAAPAISQLLACQAAVAAHDVAAVCSALQITSEALEKMYASLSRMYEWCDPYIYYNRVRPYIHGWQGNPAIPDGIAYEGVSEYAGKKIALRGETGAQSTLIPALDALLGSAHVQGPLSAHLSDMRRYMPGPHRAFLETIERQGAIRPFVIAEKSGSPQLGELYNVCINWIEKFREKHLEFAIAYIDKQIESTPGNPTKVGTGATPYVEYLRRHKEHAATCRV